MIDDMQASNVIKIISLASFPELQDTSASLLSTRLGEEYGDPDFLECERRFGFDGEISTTAQVFAD